MKIKTGTLRFFKLWEPREGFGEVLGLFSSQNPELSRASPSLHAFIPQRKEPRLGVNGSRLEFGLGHVSVSSYCSNKSPRTLWLKIISTRYLTVMEVTNPKSVSLGQGVRVLGSSGGSRECSSFWPFSASGSHLHALPCGPFLHPEGQQQSSIPFPSCLCFHPLISS